MERDYVYRNEEITYLKLEVFILKQILCQLIVPLYFPIRKKMIKPILILFFLVGCGWSQFHYTHKEFIKDSNVTKRESIKIKSMVKEWCTSNNRAYRSYGCHRC